MSKKTEPHVRNQRDDLSDYLEAAGFQRDPSLTEEEATVAQVRDLVSRVQTQRGAEHEVARLRALEAELPSLRALADQGRRYRVELLEQALLAGRAAQGVTFAEAEYRAMLADAPLETIQTLRDDWVRSTSARGDTARAAVPKLVVH